MVNLFQYLQDKKGKQIPFKIKLLNNIPLTKDDLIINGNLDLSWSKILYLPDNLTVNGHLDLSNSKIEILPNNLIVNGYLDLSNSKIEILPNNLIVNGYLDIGETNIFELPDDLYVQCDLWCENTPLAYKIEKNKSLLNKYQKQVKRKIFYDW